MWSRLALGKGVSSLIAHARLALKWHWRINFALKAKLSGRAQRWGYPKGEPISAQRQGYPKGEPISAQRRGRGYSRTKVRPWRRSSNPYISGLFFNDRSNSKYFEIWTIPCQIYENFEGGFINTPKRQTLRQLFNRSELYLAYRHLQKISHKQADDQFYPPRVTKQKLGPRWSNVTAGQLLLLKRPK